MKHISKSFPGVMALDDVTFSVGEGEVHALVGENGAGKSTLMKIINGVYSADQGEIYISGKKVSIKNPLDAQRNGVSIIFQEFNLVDTLSVAENIFIGRLGGKKKMIDWKSIYKEAEKLLKSLNYDLDPRAAVETLSVAQMQMTEIAKAMSFDAKIIIMDEPSAVLTDNELKKLFDIVEDLKKRGITVIYISHRLEEIFQICDKVTVLRDGKIIDTGNVEDLNKEQIIEMMVGRKLDQEFPKREKKIGDVILRAKGLRRGDRVQDVSFELRRGEILGFAGLVGAGRTETMRLLFGADQMTAGSIELNGKQVHIKSPMEAKGEGIALLPEDRKKQGLLLELPITENISLVKLKKVMSKGNLINKKKEKDVAKGYFDSLKIKAPSVTQRVYFLSGGNQQKVVIAKWLFSDADIFILDEPTRGIDVGAKYEIYMLMNELVAQGKSIILISSEMNEIIAMSDRIMVMHDGKICAELNGEEITPENVLKHAIN
ncbi:sugar ABC transporter ATP-binding protein [Christensenella sp. NSJ-35]|uniref:Sugar ABC transporter ATP-binding protein n=2 Tax=Christensenella tenuis TaxID=2763033 RepID=A0ABR7EJB5_9FIRM|nr:sugar ABC transporter ATP-binding protein [Christensenella tenuis]MBC5649234.1 sugar ABC transporter ATP-binding protein [Christensenella tenuis]